MACLNVSHNGGYGNVVVEKRARVLSSVFVHFGVSPVSVVEKLGPATCDTRELSAACSEDLAWHGVDSFDPTFSQLLIDFVHYANV